MDASSISPSPHKNKKLGRVYINNQIRAKEVRVVDEAGKQLGVMGIFEAIDLAKSKGFDLIQVTEKADPPVCRIMDYGKFLYHQQKKEKETRHHQKGGELKAIRLTFAISDHDIEIKAKKAKEFLKIGDKVKVDMKLRGRQKALSGFAKEKIKKFIDELEKLIPLKLERDLKREAGSLTMIISADTKKQEEEKKQ